MRKHLFLSGYYRSQDGTGCGVYTEKLFLVHSNDRLLLNIFLSFLLALCCFSPTQTNYAQPAVSPPVDRAWNANWIAAPNDPGICPRCVKIF